MTRLEYLEASPIARRSQLRQLETFGYWDLLAYRCLACRVVFESFSGALFHWEATRHMVRIVRLISAGDA